MEVLECSQDFSHYNPMGMETRVLIRSDPKPNAVNPPPNDALDEIWLWSASWSQRYSCLKVWTHEWMDARTHARTPARVPSYKLTESLRLRWAKKLTKGLNCS